MNTTSLPTRQRAAIPLLGACLCAFAASAQAQSSVVIYGIIDQGITKANDSTTPASSMPGRVAGSAWNVKAGNTSRIGFRGREDLGDGSYARFQIEHRLAVDTGAASSASVFWLGRSVVAVGNSRYGEIYAGREYSAAYWVPLYADPTAWSYVGQLGSAYSYAGWTAVATSIEASNIRWANSMGYKSPNLGGLSFELATAAGEGARPRGTNGNLQYRNGPLWLAAAFDRLTSKNNLSLVAAGYNFGVLFPTATYSRAKGGLNGDATAFSLSLRIPTGFGRGYVNTGRLRPANGLDSTLVATGIEYDLSKRTLLYADLASAKKDKATRTNAFDFGVKHTF